MVDPSIYKTKVVGKSDEKEYQVNKLKGERVLLDGSGASQAWKNATLLNDFSYPWQAGVLPRTEFKALWDKEKFYFIFEADDTEIVVDHSEPDENEQIGASDRVELFFKKDDNLQDHYYCLEIDSSARILTFRCRYYRQYEYDWQWPEGALSVKASVHNTGYTVEGAISMAALSNLGLVQNNCIKAGVFRANYVSAGSSVEPMWVSWVAPQTERPDFHVPSAFGRFRLI